MKKTWMISFVCMICLAVFIHFMVTFLNEEKPKVVVVLKVLNTQYWKTVALGAEKAFDDFGINGEVIAPDREYPSTKQIEILKKVLRNSPDAIIVSPTQPTSTIPTLIEFKKKNIPVLLVDTDANWNDKTTFIGTDNPTLGKKAGELLGSMLMPGDQVALISGMGPVSQSRILGAKRVLEDVGIEIVSEQIGFEKNGDLKPVMDNILQTHPDIQGVFATQDILALEALKIINEKELKIPVVGSDGIWEMIKSIEEEKLSTTVAQNPYDMGYRSVEQALKAIQGKPVEKRIDTGIDIIYKENAKVKLDLLAEITK